MKGVEVYHAIQVLRSQGYSFRVIAGMLRISPTTVQRYAKLEIGQAQKKLIRVIRVSRLDPYRLFFLERISRYPKLRASKMYRQFRKNHPEVMISERTFRDYIRKLKQVCNFPSRRTFAPVDHKAGKQLQADPGEMKVSGIWGEEIKIYFIAFYLSYSKKGFVYYQYSPIKTRDFIRAHLACFEYLGFIPSQIVYDQTKLVAISEKYREVIYNKKFIQFLTGLEISPYVCEGYDPQSKGCVERFVQEIKEDFLYGERFVDIDDIRLRSLDWLSARDERIHSTTGKKPAELFIVEQELMRSYEANCYEERKSDKFGFISWRGNKYSVPCEYQQQKVLVREEDGVLKIKASESEMVMASHQVSSGKGETIRNNNHYRDYGKLLDDLKTELLEIFSQYESGREFIEKLLRDNPVNPRDQLRAVRQFRRSNPDRDWNGVIAAALNFSTLRATKIEQIIDDQIKQEKLAKIRNDLPDQKAGDSVLQRPLSFYAGVCRK